MLTLNAIWYVSTKSLGICDKRLAFQDCHADLLIWGTHHDDYIRAQQPVLSTHMGPFKRQKLSNNTKEDGGLESQGESHDNNSNDECDPEDFSATDNNDSPDTADDITGAKRQRSRQTSKRKIRATGITTFGATLQSLLNTDAPHAAPLSLKPSISRKRDDEKLELRAKRILQVEKKNNEDKARITDVIGGWGGESERTLRKVAQRGGVALFYSTCSC